MNQFKSEKLVICKYHIIQNRSLSIPLLTRDNYFAVFFLAVGGVWFLDLNAL